MQLMAGRQLALAMLAGAAMSVSATAANLYVSTNDVHAVEGSALGWGTYRTDDGEPHNAYTNLQQALTAAKGNDTIWVEDGFVCDAGVFTNDVGKTLVYRLGRKSGAVTLRGRSGDWRKGPVIRGRWQTDVDATATSPCGPESVSGIVLPEKSTLLGFRIEHVALNPGYPSGGSAVNARYASITNCLIADGVTDYPAVFHATLWNCVVTNYQASGAVMGESGSLYNTLVVDCATTQGGFVQCNNGNVVSNCVFTGLRNLHATKTIYGAIIAPATTSASAKPVCVYDCVFSNNATYCVSDSWASRYAVFTNCVFTGNRLKICASTQATTAFDFFGCTFTDNAVADALLGGAGTYVNCLVARNTTTGANKHLLSGGSETLPLVLRNCTIVGNTVAGKPANGTVVAVNTILSDNAATAAATLASATNCCLSTDLEATLAGNGNVFADDPKLGADGAQLYRPRGSSPCRDAGTAEAYALPAFDLSGRAPGDHVLHEVVGPEEDFDLEPACRRPDIPNRAGLRRGRSLGRP